MVNVCMECVGVCAMKMIEKYQWIDKAGDEALGLLHKLAYPECKIPIEHCHDKEKEN